MARKEATFVGETGRDKGKQFHITEMSASKAESWAIRVLLAIGNAGIDIPDGLAEQGMAGLMAVGYMNLLKIPFETAKPLLDEMMECVQISPSANVKRPLIEDDIEEVTTRLQLRKAIWSLHMDFFLDASQSTSESKVTDQPDASLTIRPPRKR
ncbi:hypothetical protein UFOVP148_53 [uncultured Caudovirales phage]|uniref:Uncharacterized protein n=1 Tax=uncultured Caudovirales phage TaxID=2100421 RepID=A0A6J7W8G7_9CAUD|nr:hypothetical protein UFOVP148_53 [uncultured Caudovirales phage]